MFKRFLNLLAVVTLCVVIAVYSLHLFTLLTAPEAIQDAQYAISFTLSGAFGWLMGVAVFFLFNQLIKKEPRLTPYLFIVWGVYAVLLIAASLLCEGLRSGGRFGASLFLIGDIPLILALSPMAMGLLPLSPVLLAVELAAFLPLLLFLAILWRKK